MVGLLVEERLGSRQLAPLLWPDEPRKGEDSDANDAQPVPPGRHPLMLLALLPLAAAAPVRLPAVPATSSSDRLFLAFVPEAAVVENQWWEGQFEYADYNALDVYLLRGVVAFQPWKRWEIGARVGFGNTDTPAGVADGTGATDLDVWGKYYLGKSGDATEFAVGGLVTVPTGDDAAGLGLDAFSSGGFGSLRHRFERFILSVHAGVRFNGDGQIFAAMCAS